MSLNSLEEVIECFVQAGIRAPPSIEFDGKIHRFPHDDHDKKKSAWYIGFSNVTSSGENLNVVVGGSFKTGDQFTYQSNGVHSLKRLHNAASAKNRKYDGGQSRGTYIPFESMRDHGFDTDTPVTQL